MLAALAVAFAWPLVLADEARVEFLAEKATDLREEIRALETLRRATPTLDQAEWMLHAARFLARDRAELEARRAAILSEQREAFRRFLEEDEKDRGFSPGVERAAAVASGRMKDLEEAYEMRLSRITAAVRDLLTPEQETAVERRGDRRGAAPHRPPRTEDEVMSLLLRIRDLPETDYRRREGEFAAFALRSPGVNREVERDEVVDAMRRFRAAKEEDLPGLRDGIVERLFPGVRARELQKQIAVLKQPEDGPPGNLGRMLECRVAVSALESVVRRLREGKATPVPGGDEAPPPAPPDPQGRKEREREKRRDGEEEP